jgi:Kdo2-lipid IVA lauroyltransferase/acyltransferase
MASRALKRLSHRLEYLLLRSMQAILSALPRPVALHCGALLGFILYRWGAYRRIVRKNMAFVNIWPEAETRRITRRLYRAMGRYAVDFLRPGRLPPYRVNNFNLVTSSLEKGKGIIILLGHFGNWELLADIYGVKVDGLHVVAKPMRNRLVDRWLARKRAAASVETIYVDQALRKIYQAIKGNRVVAILIDQHAGSQGTLVPLLGKETSTVRTVAGLVRKTGCTVIPTYAILRDDNSYDIEISVAPELDLTGKSEEECITALQRQHNDILSSWIKENPEHWFGWFHKRFREGIKYKE